jgi:hypothetical protein
MIHVVEHELDITFPSSHLRFVLMQPFVRFSMPLREPYHWDEAAANDQRTAVQRTLDLAVENGNVPHFTLFPEYAIPGLAGVQVINEIVRSAAWPKSTVVIGGVDGLTCADYRALVEMNDVSVDEANAHAQVLANQWVNCCVTWTKEEDGHVRLWLQPKIRPASPELRTAHSDMFCGSAVNVFKARYDRDNYPCRFVAFICFDWIAQLDGECVPARVLRMLNETWIGTPSPLHWAFVLQQNARPNHFEFLNSTNAFLTATTWASVERNYAVVVQAANAASDRPCRTGGGAFSSFVFSPTAPFVKDACKQTFCMTPQRLRGSDALSRCTDVLLREMGPCIHVCNVRVPKFVTGTVADRVYPVTSAQVHALHEGAPTDPRLPGGSVPASVKWVNDQIDLTVCVAEADLDGAPLREPMQESHKMVSSAVRGLSAAEIERRIGLAMAVSEEDWAAYMTSPFCDVDQWDSAEGDALEHVLASLAILATCHTADAAASSLHARLTAPGVILQVAAVIGTTHENCRQHYDRAARVSGIDPVILITRDSGNNRPAERERVKIFDSTRDPGLRMIDYRTMIQACIDANSVEELRGKLHDIFRPDEKRII